jgi:hypothetical protein
MYYHDHMMSHLSLAIDLAQVLSTAGYKCRPASHYGNNSDCQYYM